MDRGQEQIGKDLVLVGGGHSHAIVLRMFGMRPLPGVRLTLITEASDTPYSGMLPGHVAGFYHHEECHIDLRPLAQFAQAQLYVDRVVGLDLARNQVLCANRPPVAFDVVSIDIGSTPNIPALPGIQDSVIPVKPIKRFLPYWEKLCERVARSPQAEFTIGIVGGGTGGIELALNAQHRLHQILAQAGQPKTNLQMHLFQRGAEVMPTHNAWVRQRMQQILAERGITLHVQETVQSVERGKVLCESGLAIACDEVLWVTQATAAEWLGKSGLAVDEAGFLLVQDTLQSISHPHVFAAGDVATMVNHPRPKAGVFAVRQGKPLFNNLQRFLQGKSLKPYHPQKDYLSLIGTGDRSAVASRAWFGWESSLLWQWKDYIDRKFMAKFSNLPAMNTNTHLKTANNLPHPSSLLAKRGEAHPHPSSPPPHPSPRHCAGCGSKVGSSTLERVLTRVQQEQPEIQRDDILVGLDAPDDAAVVQVPIGQAMVQTVDYFRSLINDPFVFGQISTNHCLSDLFAMGATPQSALAIATLPYATEAKQEETLYQLLSGALKTLHQANAALIGGHTTAGTELAFGLTCNGLIAPDRLLRKRGMQPGQVLTLTKAIGTGTLFAAEMQGQAKGHWLDEAIASMLQSNQVAADIFLQHGATACTDITGFGLLGHLAEMLRASQVAAKLVLEAVPILPGARETVQQGIVSSLHPQNLSAAHLISNLAEVSRHPHYALLFDPQTSGGLLATIPEDQASACLASLQAAGYDHSHIIGQTIPALENSKLVTIVV
jgi:selenide, water dikinase